MNVTCTVTVINKFPITNLPLAIWIFWHNSGTTKSEVSNLFSIFLWVGLFWLVCILRPSLRVQILREAAIHSVAHITWSLVTDLEISTCQELLDMLLIHLGWLHALSLLSLSLWWNHLKPTDAIAFFPLCCHYHFHLLSLRSLLLVVELAAPHSWDKIQAGCHWENLASHSMMCL